MDGTISVIHFNSRSLISNLSKIKQCLRKIDNKFSVIAISETWLNEEHINMVRMEGYELIYMNRTHIKGGGVALYIDEKYKCRSIKNKSFALDDIMECITVEIEMQKSKNILISCV